MNTRNRSRQFSLETLERRELLSWTPSTIPNPIAPPSGAGQYVMTNNSFTMSGVVSNIQGPSLFQEVTFVPSRTTTYTISVNDTPNSYMAPIWAVWNSSGHEIGCFANSNAQRNTSGTINLTQGQRYELGIENLTHYVGGAFTCTVTGAPVSKGWDYPDGNCFTSGTAILNGNTLTVSMYSSNTSWNTTYTHYMYVELVTANNQVLWSCGPFTEYTYGTAPWEPNQHSQSHTWTYNVAQYNLTGLDHIVMW